MQIYKITLINDLPNWSDMIIMEHIFCAKIAICEYEYLSLSLLAMNSTKVSIKTTIIFLGITSSHKIEILEYIM